jgi:hypothetical protein
MSDYLVRLARRAGGVGMRPQPARPAWHHGPAGIEVEIVEAGMSASSAATPEASAPPVAFAEPANPVSLVRPADPGPSGIPTTVIPVVAGGPHVTPAAAGVAPAGPLPVASVAAPVVQRSPDAAVPPVPAAVPSGSPGGPAMPGDVAAGPAPALGEAGTPPPYPGAEVVPSLVPVAGPPRPAIAGETGAGSLAEVAVAPEPGSPLAGSPDVDVWNAGAEPVTVVPGVTGAASAPLGTDAPVTADQDPATGPEMTVELVSPAPGRQPGMRGTAPSASMPERVIQVTIGALEIHAAPPPVAAPGASAPAPAPAPTAAPEGGFAEFTSLRTYARAGW